MHKKVIPLRELYGWPEPDMSVLEPPKKPAPRLSDADIDWIFGPMVSWLRSAAHVKNTPLDFIALALLSTAGAMIGNKCWASPWRGWKEPPILWAMLVGDPSSGKSPALDAVLDPLIPIEGELNEEYSNEFDKWKAANELAELVEAHWKKEVKAALAQQIEPPAKPPNANCGKPPNQIRIRIVDATPEKIVDLLAGESHGLLNARDELSGWIESMNRYASGGDREFWIEAYGGRSYVVDRKSKLCPTIVERLSVSILGGIQPEKLDRLLLRSEDDGLLARFLTVYPDPVPLTRPKSTLNDTFLTEIYKRLYALPVNTDQEGNTTPFQVPFSNMAQESLLIFGTSCREVESDVGSKMKSHIGKLPGIVVRTSLVLAILDWAAQPGPLGPPGRIEKEHVSRAIRYVGEHLKQHTLRSYGRSVLPKEFAAATRVAMMILDEGLEIVEKRKIQRRTIAGLTTAADLGEALKVLIDANWIRQIPSSGPGRPSANFEVNPMLRSPCRNEIEESKSE